MTAKDIFEILEKESNFYIKQLRKCEPGNYLLRAAHRKIETIEKWNHNVEERKPRNMPQHIHDMLNHHFFCKYGWKIRNGVFTYGFDTTKFKPIDLGYGNFFLFFPVGEFKYVYSKEHFDLFCVVDQLQADLHEFIQKLELHDSEFCNTMKTRNNYHNFANETSINVADYYMVNMNYTNDLTMLIWGK